VVRPVIINTLVLRFLGCVMKAFSSAELLRILCAEKLAFVDARIALHSKSGNVFSGIFIDAVHGNGQGTILLKSTTGGDLQWIALEGLESLSIGHPNDQQLAILNNQDFDPLSGQSEPGQLALSREIQAVEDKLKELVSGVVKVELSADTNDSDATYRTLQKNSLRMVMSMLPDVIKTLFSDDFARKEFSGRVDVIVLSPSDSCKVGIDARKLKIECPWKDSSVRWTQQALKQSINDAF
jgi:hypothetical protein